MRDTRCRAIFSDSCKKVIFAVNFAATFSIASQTALAQPQQPTCISQPDPTQKEHAEGAYRILKRLIDSSRLNAQTIAFDEGTYLGLDEAVKEYATMTDEDKDRLNLPDKIEAFRAGDFGTFAVGGRHFEMTIDETRPDVTSLTFVKPINVDANNPLIYTSAGQTSPVRLMKYYGASNVKKPCGDVLLVDTSRQRFNIKIKNNMVATRVPTLEWINGRPADDAYWQQDAPASEFPPGNTDGLFTANLHTHGLHVSPEAHHDNVFLKLQPRPTVNDIGRSIHLSYRIKPDHVAGTFWYHPHLHHSAAYQVASGLVGPLLTITTTGSRATDLDDIPEVAAANVKAKTIQGNDIAIGRVLLLQQFLLSEYKETAKIDGNTTNVLQVNPTNVNDRRQLKDTSVLAAGTDNSTPPYDFIAVNGGEPANISMQPGQIERWRLVCATKEASVPLLWFKVTSSNNVDWVASPVTESDLKVFRIAEDGIPYADTVTTNGVEDFVNHAVASQVIEMYPGYRSDLLIQPTTPGTYILVNGPGSSQETTQVLARIQVSGVAASMKMPTVVSIKRCVPKDIFPPNANPTKINQAISFEFLDTIEFGVDGAPYVLQNQNSLTQGPPYVEPIVQYLNKPERWQLSVNVPAMANSGTNPPMSPPPDDAGVVFSRGVCHPFHIHVNPFQVELPGGKLMWKDTYVISQQAPAVIRIEALDYVGKAVLHCHTMDHEDQGMMRNIEIRAVQPEKRLRANRNERTAPVANFEKGTAHVAVVFSGPACVACNEWLKKIDAVSDVIHQSNAKITAISREKLDTPVTIAGLDVIDANTMGEEIQTLVGSRNIPSHAVYLIDKRGAIRFEFTGEHPFEGLPDIVSKIGRLASE